MQQEYVPRVGDRVLVNSKGSADEGCGAYTDYWFPGGMSKVNCTQKNTLLELCQVKTQEL